MGSINQTVIRPLKICQNKDLACCKLYEQCIGLVFWIDTIVLSSEDEGIFRVFYFTKFLSSILTENSNVI